MIAITLGDGGLWALSQPANPSDPNGSTATLTQIDPRANRIVGTPTHLRTPQPIAIAVSGHDLWIADFDGGLRHFKLTDRWRLSAVVPHHDPRTVWQPPDIRSDDSDSRPCFVAHPGLPFELLLRSSSERKGKSSAEPCCPPSRLLAL